MSNEPGPHQKGPYLISIAYHFGSFMILLACINLGPYLLRQGYATQVAISLFTVGLLWSIGYVLKRVDFLQTSDALIFAGQMLGGIVAGTLGASMVAAILLPFDNTNDMLSGFGAGIAGLMTGYPAGIIVGVYLVGKLFRRQGSFWLTCLGSIMGVFFSFWFSLFPFFFIVSVFATFGFNMAKRGRN
jgi:hypothetical protein